MTESVLRKLQAEHQSATQRAGGTVAGIRNAAVVVITAMLEQEIERLRQGEEAMLQYRVDLNRVTQWAGANGTALRLSTVASSTLANLPDPDRARVMPSDAVPPWERFLKRLLEDPNATLASIEDSAASQEAAE